ncbi:MAG: SDR family oxidoreductase [Saprospiraceae bacterium]|nr:SDR family oxidoreductase [Saprospiraceae bacterium]
MDLFSLKGKIAVITGASGLIGKKHCEALAMAGAKVVACDLKIDKNYWKDENQHSVFSFDVSVKDQVLEAKNQIIEKYGTIDILVNNAAINDMFENPAMAAEQSKFENYPLEMWQKSLDVNVTGVFICSQVFGTVMAEKGSGSIINIASTYGMVGPDQTIYKDPEGHQVFFKSASYPATKGAILNFTRFLASYWGPSGVRVNSLSPGGVSNGQEDWFIQNYSAKTCLGRMASSGDYQGALIFLSGDASSYMTGANLVVDGGWTAI